LTRTYQLDPASINTTTAGALTDLQNSTTNSPSNNFMSSMRSQRTSLDPRTTGSSMIKELKSRDQHLGALMRESSFTKSQLKREKRFATLYNGF